MIAGPICVDDSCDDLILFFVAIALAAVLWAAVVGAGVAVAVAARLERSGVAPARRRAFGAVAALSVLAVAFAVFPLVGVLMVAVFPASVAWAALERRRTLAWRRSVTVEPQLPGGDLV